MAPIPTTHDYYMILEVVQTAPLQEIIRSYKRLAFKLHPDRNAQHDATQVFQLLGEAYETLKDESSRRAYDLRYPSIRSHPVHQSTHDPRSPPASSSQSDVLNDDTQIAALQKSKQDRTAQWQVRKKCFDSLIFELSREVRRLEQDIRNLESIEAAEKSAEAKKNSWGTWLMSPLYRKVEDSEEDKERKDRERQERKIQKVYKETVLSRQKDKLKKEEDVLQKAQEVVEAADLADDRKIAAIRKRFLEREHRERQAREEERLRQARKVWQEQQQREQREQRARQEQREQEEKREQERQRAERERLEKIRKQEQAQRERRQAARVAAIRKQQSEQHRAAAERRQQDEQPRSPSNCEHNGWWAKVQGRTTCPECSDVWTYLLQCPGCSKKACPKCQAAVRPRIQRGGGAAKPYKAPDNAYWFYDE